MSYEDKLIRESTGEYQGREQHWCSRCECEAEDCVGHEDLSGGPESEQYLRRPLDAENEAVSAEPPAPEFIADFPVEVRIALMVLLNHIEPGYENCKTVVRAWLKLIEREGPR